MVANQATLEILGPLIAASLYDSVGPGSYIFRVRRVGIQNTGITTLIKDFDVVCSIHDPPGGGGGGGGSAQPPHIDVAFSGTISDAKFHVTGNGFLNNRPASSQGIAIRAVDANALMETRREFAPSSAEGKIDHTIEGDLTGLTLNASGVGTVAIPASDGRPNPGDSSGFLWSNTVSINFSA